MSAGTSDSDGYGSGGSSSAPGPMAPRLPSSTDGGKLLAPDAPKRTVQPRVTLAVPPDAAAERTQPRHSRAEHNGVPKEAWDVEAAAGWSSSSRSMRRPSKDGTE